MGVGVEGEQTVRFKFPYSNGGTPKRETNASCTGYEVLTQLITISAITQMTTCRLVNCYQRFGRLCCHWGQGSRPEMMVGGGVKNFVRRTSTRLLLVGPSLRRYHSFAMTLVVYFLCSFAHLPSRWGQSFLGLETVTCHDTAPSADTA